MPWSKTKPILEGTVKEKTKNVNIKKHWKEYRHFKGGRISFLWVFLGCHSKEYLGNISCLTNDSRKETLLWRPV